MDPVIPFDLADIGAVTPPNPGSHMWVVSGKGAELRPAAILFRGDEDTLLLELPLTPLKMPNETESQPSAGTEESRPE